MRLLSLAVMTAGRFDEERLMEKQMHAVVCIEPREWKRVARLASRLFIATFPPRFFVLRVQLIGVVFPANNIRE